MAKKIDPREDIKAFADGSVPKQKRKKVVETPLDERQKLPTFVEKYEESLLRQLFEEEIKKKKLEAEENEESDYYEESSVKQHVKRDGEWDVLLGEDIYYFDPTLSYEITGYRPINMEEGLDFDPEPFIETRRTFERTGNYTEYPKGCKPYVDFWNEQKKRCVEGYTVGKYRVTGDHYFFLNFYTMQTVNLGSEKATGGRLESFPSFLAKQYEFFHYIDLCEYVGKDCAMLKARGLGFSEILASLGSRPFITTRRFHTIYAAAADTQLDPVLDKCWTQLNWLNTNTNGGMKRSRQKIDNLKHKRASVVTKEGTEIGWMSEIEGVIADNPRKIRGNRVERLIFEEAGSFPQLIKSWIQGNALVELGGRKIGTRICGGTGGDSGPQLAGLSRMFNNPLGYNILPYKNTYSRDGKVQYTGFFIPAHEFSLDPKYLDNRGVTDSIEFKKYYEKQRSFMEGKDLLTYCAEHCFTPDEALLKQGDNIFDAELLSDRITKIRVHKQYNKPKPFILQWKDPELKQEVIATEVVTTEGRVLVSEPPLVDESGSVYKNLYVAGIDSIDIGTQDSATDYDVSDFCIVIKRRAFGMMPPKYVAMYKFRPRDIREAYKTALKLMVWYNCKAMLEYTKIGIQKDFQAIKKDHLFMKRPEFAVSGKTKMSRQSKQLIGVPATEAVIKHGLELISAYVSDYCSEIDFDDMLEQLLNYSYEDKRKFDIIAAMSMAELGDEEMTGLSVVKTQSINEWKDVGYYRDENGVKRYGVIPNKNQNKLRWPD